MHEMLNVLIKKVGGIASEVFGEDVSEIVKKTQFKGIIV